MTKIESSTLFPAALWLANILSMIGISIAGWVLITVNGLNAQVSSLQASVSANTFADEQHHNDKDLHMPTDRKYELFVSRGEYEAMQSSRMSEFADLKVQVRENNALLRQVLERLSRMEGASNN